MHTRNSLAVFAAVFMVAGLTGCGNTESNDESPQNDGATVTTALNTTTSSTSSTAATTTTEPPTTTTEVPASTTTTQPIPWGAWSVDGATFVAGQCFAAGGSSSGPLGSSQAGEIGPGTVSMRTGVAHPTESVPCDGPHDGEVMATGPACPIGSIGGRIDMTHLTKDIDHVAVAEVAAEYLGVDLAGLGDWLTERDLVLRYRRQVDDDMIITDTMCVLGPSLRE